MRTTPYFDLINNSINVGTLVKASPGRDLVCGGGSYDSAIVARRHPLILISRSGDMVWSQKTVDQVVPLMSIELENQFLVDNINNRFTDGTFNDDEVKYHYKESDGSDIMPPFMLATYFSDKITNNKLYDYAKLTAGVNGPHLEVGILIDDRKELVKADLIEGDLYDTNYVNKMVLINDTHAFLMTIGSRWVEHVNHREALVLVSHNLKTTSKGTYRA